MFSFTIVQTINHVYASWRQRLFWSFIENDCRERNDFRFKLFASTLDKKTKFLSSASFSGLLYMRLNAPKLAFLVV